MKTRNWNWSLVRCDDPNNFESYLSFQWRKVRNLWLQIKKQYWNLIDK